MCLIGKSAETRYHLMKQRYFVVFGGLYYVHFKFYAVTISSKSWGSGI